MSRIEIAIHARMERITPPIPSPASGISISKPSNFGVLLAYLCNLSLFKIFPTLSFNFKPEYNPALINIKNVPAKTDVDKIEFRNNERWSAFPESQTLKITIVIIASIEKNKYFVSRKDFRGRFMVLCVV